MIKAKKIIALFVTVIMAVSCFTFAGASYIMHDWAKAEVLEFEAWGLMPKDFPTDLTSDITRAEFSSLAVSVYEKCRGEIKLTGENVFSDTSDENVLKAREIGVTEGVSDTEFMPERNITRQEICVMLSRLLNSLDINVAVTMQIVIFDDSDLIAPWADNSVQLMYKLGVINGVSDDAETAVVAPLNSTTRQQAIAMVWRMYDKHIKESVTDKGEEPKDLPSAGSAPSSVAKSEPSKIAAGDYTSYKVNGEGVLSAWGKNDVYQLGLKNNNETVYTMNVSQNVSSVAAAASHAYYISNGVLYAFGDGETPHALLENVRYVLALRDKSFAITNDGELYSWGRGAMYTLGTGDTDDVNVPVKILDNVSKVTAYSGFAAALTSDGTVYQWGDTRIVSEVYGAEDIENKMPTPIMKNVADIACGSSHLLMLSADGELYGWGSNLSGQLIPGANGGRYSEPVLVASGVDKMWAANEITFYTNSDKYLYAIGKNTGWRMGSAEVKDNELAKEPAPVTSNVEKLFINDNSVFAIKSDAKVWVWGQNFNYRLGLKDEKDRHTPAHLSEIDGALDFAFGFDHTLAITDDSLYVWGQNEENQCTSRYNEFKKYTSPILHSNIAEKE